MSNRNNSTPESAVTPTVTGVDEKILCDFLQLLILIEPRKDREAERDRLNAGI
jgi:hypothetical protein